ncbi:hypothetical protein [Acidimangrovimonas pyrenivorans]|uniref:Uncharacterized protein n=1 Tax=Acidimangrovimonas pyrenivorans TaxID=2030798 RepID=A0ABV7AFC3_9RHOB
MTIHTPDEGEAPKPLVSEASLLYTTAAEVFSLLIRELENGETAEAKKAPAYARELRQALQAVLTERAIIEKLRKEEAGIVHDHALDFDAARVEIGRRLARLRDAGAG